MTLRDALTAALEPFDLGKLHDPSLKTEHVADAILAMPEMKWIRDLLRDLMAEGFLGENQHSLAFDGLPDSVREWMLS